MTDHSPTLTPFAGQHVVVTGGSSGIGRAAALIFARQGAETVFITGRDAERLKETATLHPKLVPVVADVSTAEGADAVEAAVGAGPGVLDVLVHNAGITKKTPLGRVDMADVMTVLGTNLIGPLILTDRLLPRLRAPGASIVLVTSVEGHRPPPFGSSLYAASKAGGEMFTRAWAVELGERGIRVNAVAPGVTRTDAAARAGFSPADARLALEIFGQATIAGRVGEPEEVAVWITRLAEPGSAYVTGQVISVDGGIELTGIPRKRPMRPPAEAADAERQKSP
ncbi:SDR family NAD(P)-dependent oxidoreductase [Nonomuraea sp. CA-143628]|uniref:SDR family NAD(P)-dependent oxidoreductase n=1 Tax=Nonomuraea sp. CA-143628 TaxID=3239997 RepID=UPI003D91E31C